MPEQFGSTNMWRLLAGEQITGTDGQSIVGPLIVRILDYDDGLHSIQADTSKGEVKIEIQGNFPELVKRISPPTNQNP